MEISKGNLDIATGMQTIGYMPTLVEDDSVPYLQFEYEKQEGMAGMGMPGIGGMPGMGGMPQQGGFPNVGEQELPPPPPPPTEDPPEPQEQTMGQGGAGQQTIPTALIITMQKQYRGADKNQPTRTVTSRSGKQSFTDHVCEAGYHSHGNRKCHAVTEKHNGQTIIDMGGEWAYRVQHPSIQFKTPMQQPYSMMEQYGNTAMTKMLRLPEVILMKQGGYDPCPGEGIHGHPGYSGCHSSMQKHRKSVRDILGGWDTYVAWHPFEAKRDNPDEQAGQSQETQTQKPTRKRKPAKKSTTARKPRATKAQAKPDSGVQVVDDLEQNITSAGEEENLKPADMKVPQATKKSPIRRDKETQNLIFETHDPRLKFNTPKEKQSYINDRLPKNAINVEYNDELLNDKNPYMLSSNQWLAKFDTKIAYKKASGEVVERVNRGPTMYAGKYRAEQEITKWNNVLNYANSFGAIKKDALSKVTSSGAGSTDWKLGMMMLFFQQSGLRIGSEKGVEEFGTYGISTLRPEHVSIEGNKVSLNFTGKKQTENITEFTVPKQVASELSTYLRGIPRNAQDQNIWGITDVKNNRGADYSWADHYRNYVTDTYNFTPHNVRHYDMSTLIVNEYMEQKVYESPDRKEREKAVMSIVRNVAKGHGSESAASVVKNYTPFEMLDKLVEGNSIKHAKGFIEEHLKAMGKEVKAMDKLRSSGTPRRRRRRR